MSLARRFRWLSLVLALVLIFDGLTGWGAIPVVVDYPSVQQVLGYMPSAYLKAVEIDGNRVSFLWDSGKSEALSDREREFNLRFFLLALAIPDDHLWVNLNILLNDLNVMGHELLYTDLGKVLMYSDVQLKKDVDRLAKRIDLWSQVMDYSYSVAPEGVDLELNPRFWIVPGEISTYFSRNGIIIDKADLDVMFELKEPRAPGPAHRVWSYARGLIESQLVPELVYVVNHDDRYALLRQVYRACIIAQWYKKYAKDRIDFVFDQLVDSGAVGGLRSDHPWSPREYLEQYVAMYKRSMWEDYGEGWEFYTGGVVLAGAFEPDKPGNNPVPDVGARIEERSGIKESTEVNVEKGKRRLSKESTKKLSSWLVPVIAVGGLLTIMGGVALGVGQDAIVDAIQTALAQHSVVFGSIGDQLYIGLQAHVDIPSLASNISHVTGVARDEVLSLLNSGEVIFQNENISILRIPLTERYAFLANAVLQHYGNALEGLQQPGLLSSLKAFFKENGLVVTGAIGLLIALSRIRRIGGHGDFLPVIIASLGLLAGLSATAMAMGTLPVESTVDVANLVGLLQNRLDATAGVVSALALLPGIGIGVLGLRGGRGFNKELIDELRTLTAKGDVDGLAELLFSEEEAGLYRSKLRDFLSALSSRKELSDDARLFLLADWLVSRNVSNEAVDELTGWAKQNEGAILDQKVRELISSLVYPGLTKAYQRKPGQVGGILLRAMF